MVISPLRNHRVLKYPCGYALKTRNSMSDVFLARPEVRVLRSSENLENQKEVSEVSFLQETKGPSETSSRALNRGRFC